MKLFYLLLALPLFASAQVTIPDQAARFYLERHKKATVLEEIVVIKDGRISNLDARLAEQNRLIQNLEKQVMLEKLKSDLSNTRITKLEGTNRKLVREARKQKLLKNIAIIGGVSLLILNEILDGN
jgi:uncharacterized coiled-coil protein SlyX